MSNGKKGGASFVNQCCEVASCNAVIPIKEIETGANEGATIAEEKGT